MVKNKMKKRESFKQGQVTIFIILALIIISVLLIYFLWAKPTYFLNTTEKPSIESCMADAVKSSMADMEKQSGFPELTFSYSYQGEKIPYLCYTNLYLQPCLNQKPFLTQYFTEELKKNAKAGVLQCYNNYLEDLKARGYQVVSGENSLDLNLNPGQIIIQLNAPVVISKESSEQFTTFKTTINSHIYELLLMATYIIQQETKYGDAIIDEPRILYPYIDINKINREDGNTIYFIEDKNTKDQIKFAIRSMAWPIGFGTDADLTKKQ
jgi:hypothetical protein